MSSSSDIPSQITASILASHSLPVSPAWLQANLPSSALTTTSSSPPLPSLLKTILFRLLSSDFTISLSIPPSLSPSSTTRTTIYTFPANLTSPEIQSTLLPPSAKIPVQVLDIQDIGSSLHSQLEALESAARGETRRGREIIRTIDVEAGGHGPGRITSTSTSTSSSSVAGRTVGSSAAGSTTTATIPLASSQITGPYKLLLTDLTSTTIPAFTKSPIPGITIPSDSSLNTTTTNNQNQQAMSIGTKLLLHSSIQICRGMVMLTKENVRVLGGKVEAWDREWRERRVQGLKEEIGRRAGEGTEG